MSQPVTIGQHLSVSPSVLQHERSAHNAFAATRRHRYVPVVSTINKLTSLADTHYQDWKANNPTIKNVVVIAGEPGSGKSALLAYWANERQNSNPSEKIIAHYIGASTVGSNHTSLLRHIMLEIAERYGFSEEVPSLQESIERNFLPWLWRVQNERLIIIIDGINQLTAHNSSIQWLPTYFPSNVFLIISTIPGSILHECTHRGWQVVTLPPLTKQLRQQILRTYSEDLDSSLQRHYLRPIANSSGSVNPLFLRTTLQELRDTANNPRQSSFVEQYIHSKDVGDLYQRILERLEFEYSPTCVRSVLTMLWGSRYGLSEEDLQSLYDKRSLRPLLQSLEFHLYCRNTLFTFHHEQFRFAIQKRYLNTINQQSTIHARLGHYFANQPYSLRRALEEPYQWQLAKKPKELQECLTTPEIFIELYTNDAKLEILGYWLSIAERNHIGKAYLPLLKSISKRNRNIDFIIQYTQKVAIFLLDCGLYHDSLDFANKLMKYFKNNKIHNSDVIDTAITIASAYYYLNDYNTARKKYEKVLTDLRNLNNYHDIRLAENLTNLAAVMYQIGEYQESESLSYETIEWCYKYPDVAPLTLPIALNNYAASIAFQERIEEAIKIAEQGYSIVRERIGDWHPEAMNLLSTLGSLYSMTGKFEEANSIHTLVIEKKSKILGSDHPSMAVHYISLATLFRRMLKLEEAEPLIIKAIEIRKHHFGDTNIRTISTYRPLAGFYRECGNYTKALEVLQQQLLMLFKFHANNHSIISNFQRDIEEIKNEMMIG